jgi:hypothetical protein
MYTFELIKVQDVEISQDTTKHPTSTPALLLTPIWNVKTRCCIYVNVGEVWHGFPFLAAGLSGYFPLEGN